MTPRLPTGCVIAVLGAERTGKTALAQALAARLSQRGVAAILVPDPLQAWQLQEGRPPLRQDLAALARRQTLQIAEAAQRSVVVADTTALLHAVRGERLFGDRTLYPEVIAAQRACAITLLTGCDRPDGEPTDALLRAALAQCGNPYSVVHGEGAQGLAHAWNAVNATADAVEQSGAAAMKRSAGDSGTGQWTWPCDKCSDPACEHRLFSDLLAKRSAADPR